VFRAGLPAAERYAALLAGPGTLRGLIGPREVPRLWERHVLNCAVLTDLVPEGATVCDIGSGAGLPGLAMALRRPDLKVTLVEPLLRRTTFLQEVVAELDLPQVEVVRARAEELHGRREFDVVTSRAVAPLERLLAWSLPLTREHGAVLAMKGRSAQEELDRAADTLRTLGGTRPEVLHSGENLLAVPTTVVRVEAGVPSKLRWATAKNRAGSKPRSGRRDKGAKRRR
jgi:16S rRNA (guanine527-N7)-methyltransferase